MVMMVAMRESEPESTELASFAAEGESVDPVLGTRLVPSPGARRFLFSKLIRLSCRVGRCWPQTPLPLNESVSVFTGKSVRKKKQIMVRLLAAVFTLLAAVRSTPAAAAQLEPCRNATTNQDGYCMFAFDCYKVGGTHVAVCMKGFYYGSCCRLSEPAAVNINDVDSLLDFGLWNRFYHPPAVAMDSRVNSPLKGTGHSA